VFQTRIHGRGGQGVVTAAELLSIAAFDAGLHAQAFPSFGSERTGAPVVAYCRISHHPIRNREPILVPNALIVQDATLLNQVDLLAGLPADAYVLANTRRSFTDLGLDDFTEGRDSTRLVTVAATQIALRHIGKPVPNAVLLGGFAALTGIVSLAGVQKALIDRFPGRVGEANAEAAAEAYYEVVAQQRADHRPPEESRVDPQGAHRSKGELSDAPAN
jgi:pyruvate ferredoxin oxidoreductase gamma subunit